MQITKDQLKDAISGYLKKEADANPGSISKLTISLIISSMQAYADKLIEDNKNSELLGKILDNNLVNVETLYKFAKNKMAEIGDIDILNITFEESDIDGLYKYIKNKFN